eukprot:scaffold4498_cov119-Isochrysis_galbana.AAC.23
MRQRGQRRRRAGKRSPAGTPVAAVRIGRRKCGRLRTGLCSAPPHSPGPERGPDTRASLKRPPRRARHPSQKERTRTAPGEEARVQAPRRHAGSAAAGPRLP